MKPSGTFLGTVFGLALLAALLAGAYLLLKYVGHVFASLESQTETLTAIASVVALLCAVIVAEGLKARGAGEVQAVAAAQRIATYEQLLSLWSRGGQPVERTRLEGMLALHGSAKVISAYVEFRSAAANEAAPLLHALVVEMRKDAGRSDLIRKDDDLPALLPGPVA
jgi:hypothetical protein